MNLSHHVSDGNLTTKIEDNIGRSNPVIIVVAAFMKGYTEDDAVRKTRRTGTDSRTYVTKVWNQRSSCESRSAKNLQMINTITFAPQDREKFAVKGDML